MPKRQILPNLSINALQVALEACLAMGVGLIRVQLEFSEIDVL